MVDGETTALIPFFFIVLLEFFEHNLNETRAKSPPVLIKKALFGQI